MVAENELPEYLKKKGKEERMIRIARFRLGNEMRSGRYWEDAEKRKCRICEAEEETWDHVVERCNRDEKEQSIEGIGEKVRKILNGE